MRKPRTKLTPSQGKGVLPPTAEAETGEDQELDSAFSFRGPHGSWDELGDGCRHRHGIRPAE